MAEAAAAMGEMSQAMLPPPATEYFSPINSTTALTGTPTARGPTRLPITELETAVMSWLSSHGVSDIDLRLGSTSHLNLAQGASLLPQPERDEYEKKLIDTLVDSSAVTSREFIGSNSLTSLYALYRALPHSLTADRRALLYASFCIGSFNMAHTQKGDDGYLHVQPFNLGEPREDITYYNMTMEELLRWNQPSVPACCTSRVRAPLTPRGSAATHELGLYVRGRGGNAQHTRCLDGLRQEAGPASESYGSAI